MIILNNVDLKQLASSIANCLKGNEIILLIGDLGSGKTTFTKYLVKSIDKNLEDEVNSPTFTIMNVYETDKFNIYHLDLYRVKDFDITDFIGNGIILVEWAKEEEFKELNIPILIFKFEIGKDINFRNLYIELINADYIKKCIEGELAL
jgi:tRNA threonylcarbamoyladenosine biosynthesis protein TsaE